MVPSVPPSGSQSRSARMGGPDGPEGTILLSDTTGRSSPCRYLRYGSHREPGGSHREPCGWYPRGTDPGPSGVPIGYHMVPYGNHPVPYGNRTRVPGHPMVQVWTTDPHPYPSRWYPPVPRGSFGSGPSVYDLSHGRTHRGYHPQWYHRYHRGTIGTTQGVGPGGDGTFGPIRAAHTGGPTRDAYDLAI